MGTTAALTPVWLLTGANVVNAVVSESHCATHCALFAPHLSWVPAPCLQVLTLGGELLGNAESLLRDGLHTAEIADGYQKSCAKVRAPTQLIIKVPNYS